SVSTGPVGPAIPALLTSTSSPPRRCCTSAKSAVTLPSSATSARVAYSCSCLPETAWSAASSMSHTSTEAPQRRKACAISHPRPAALAVISTRFPCIALSSTMVIFPRLAEPTFLLAEFEIGQQRRRLSLMRDSAAIQHHCGVGHRQSEIQVVIDDQDGELALEAHNRIEDFLGHGGRQPLKR